MKNLLLCSVLTALVSTHVCAEETPVNQTVPTPAPITAAPVDVKPLEAGTIPPAVVVPAPVINCEYKIPAKVTTIEPTVVQNWAKNAAIQSFSFDAGILDTQLIALKNCFTEQGWQGFNDALQKSGNLGAIKTQKLLVSSSLDGEPVVNEAKNNQWKYALPMQVIYQNSKEKITQQLTVNITIGRKPSGDLGIIQMVALPRDNGAAKPAAVEAPATVDAIPH